MSSFAEIVKKIDIKTIPLLISVLATLLLVKYLPLTKNIDIAISLIVFYLMGLGGYWLIQYQRRRKAKKDVIKSEEKRTSAKRHMANSLIYNYFLELPENKLKLLVDVINMPRIETDKYKRVVPPSSTLKSMLQAESFNIRLD